MASTNEFERRVLDFEAATTAELASLMKNGMSSRAAVRELEGRLVGAREDPATACMLPLDVVAAAQLAARLNLSVDDAKRVLVVKRQMGQLRASGMSDSAAAHQLQSRLQLSATAQLPPPVGQPSASPGALPKPAASTATTAAIPPLVPALSNDAKLFAAAAVSSPQSPGGGGGGFPSQTMARSTSGSTSPGPPPAAPTAARGRPAPAPATTAAAAAVASAVAAATEASSVPTPPSLKRSRSSESGRSTSNNNNNASDKPSAAPRPEPIVAAEKVELARQLSALTSEINDAMRAGDRAKVVLLMRRRDQLRRNGTSGTSGSSAAAIGSDKTTNGEIAEGKPKADGKRARQGSPRS